MEDRKAGVALAISIPAAIAAAAALAKKAQAAPKGELVIPKEFWDLIIAIAASAGTIDDSIQKVIQELAKLTINVQGWPVNADSITALRVAVAVTGTRLPDIAVPSGMSLVIKAWTLNPGWLQVGASLAECSNVNQSFPLLPNEVVGYQVQNANQIYIAATAAGCFACITTEQRRRGGE